jgi:hypothetical protein
VPFNASCGEVFSTLLIIDLREKPTKIGASKISNCVKLFSIYCFT